MANQPHWQIWIDTGGTFTDCVAIGPDDCVRRAKVLSSSAMRGTVVEWINAHTARIDAPWHNVSGLIDGFTFAPLDNRTESAVVEHADAASSIVELDTAMSNKMMAGDLFEVRSPEEAPVLAARLVTGTPAQHELPTLSMRLGTTRGTNALLERRGAATAFFVTEGFADLLRIGTQQRPDLFALNIWRPQPLYEMVVEVAERLDANGEVVRPLNLDEIDLARLRESGVTSAAIALLHSYKNPEHENQLAARLRDAGFEHVSSSNELAPFMKILPRAETAVVNAYLSPTIDAYLQRVAAPIRSGRLHVMTSAGGLSSAVGFTAKDGLLSGPAGGVVGAVRAAKDAGLVRIISFDMGGTSTDVARYDGEYEYMFEHEVGDAHLVAPSLAIETVAAGGGSVVSFEHGTLAVGPRSAGAVPGPACYGAGGPLTVTDVNLLLGRIDAERFDIPLNRAAAQRQVDSLVASIRAQGIDVPSVHALLQGIRTIANERMADAIRRISVRKGYDPADYTLVAYGGAGGQHACDVADCLGISHVMIPQDTSVLSAVGIGHAAIERIAERQILQPLDIVMQRVDDWVSELRDEATNALSREGVPIDRAETRRCIASLRFVGQESSLQVEADKGDLKSGFERQYREVFGYWPSDRIVELESLRVVVAALESTAPLATNETGAAVNERKQRVWVGGEWTATQLVDRSTLDADSSLTGPSLISEPFSVTVVEPGWRATVHDKGAVMLRRVGGPPGVTDEPDVVVQELFTHRFEAIARDMGEALRRTATSTNVKERLDFSCAILDSDGELVVNAPHIPVHLGALGLCVRACRDKIRMASGDVVVTNHPGFGGSHLPDVTVITPVFDDDERLIGFVANRAHHAEIGGVTPGSMPPSARCLADEGVVIAPMHLFARGEARWEVVQALLNEAAYPSRAVDENLADLRAAVAANRHGEHALRRLAEEHGPQMVEHQMAALKNRAATRIREAFSNAPDGTYEATEMLDDDTPLCVAIEIKDDHATFDFTGTAGVHEGSLNATRAVLNSAVIYTLRLLINEPLPLNEGLLSAVTVKVPAGLLDPPFAADPQDAPAVVGGNVETSQRLVDTMIKALGLSACGQGTMNNVVFGNDATSYYETVGGGSGAGDGFDGGDAVHVHMTNTRITDPEVLEYRYPVRLDRFAVRPGSGGRGRWIGGNGVVREMTFLDRMSLSVLGQHRVVAPYGMAGGRPGLRGRQHVVRADGVEIELESVDGCEMEAGDRFILETPGGGGFGHEESDE